MRDARADLELRDAGRHTIRSVRGEKDAVRLALSELTDGMAIRGNESPLTSWQDKSDELMKHLIAALVSASLEQQRNDAKVLLQLAGACQELCGTSATCRHLRMASVMLERLACGSRRPSHRK